MSRDKQISEMARDMCWEGADCSKCEGLLPCNKKFLAPRLVDKGYRRASDVAEEIFAEIDKVVYQLMNNLNYSIGEAVYDLAELKKKYKEEGK